jgi:Predicted metal binding domain
MRLIDAETGADLPGNLWPTDSASHWHHNGWTSAAGIATPQPFMCMAGIREYHTHSSHVGDLWENYRSSPDYDLPGILVQVAEAFQKSNV